VSRTRLQRSSRCCAEPGPYQTPAFVTAPASAAHRKSAALRPGHEIYLGAIQSRNPYATMADRADAAEPERCEP